MEEWPTKRTPHHTIQLAKLGDSSREGDLSSVPQNVGMHGCLNKKSTVEKSKGEGQRQKRLSHM